MINDLTKIETVEDSMKIRGDALEVDTMGITYLLYNANLTTKTM